MTMTIDLPEATMAHLIAQEQAFGRPAAAIAAEIVAERFSAAGEEEAFSMDPATIDAIQRGIEDVEAGRTYSLEEVIAHSDAALAAHLAAKAK